ncbi:predicted protein [Nematostella vectensis]|uniref:Carbohydrate kinase PfkB domain-containing protein n=1 Tax=Nematostella vectensis TaxID=45351 RepID=A7T824_NEMVE|nr:predicted protein [Nematostella vectensis]|eukprot:XP_001619972.1 hypothetical protein NEMVEDRAFT_v1g223614 [Nematostella vectensis]
MGAQDNDVVFFNGTKWDGKNPGSDGVEALWDYSTTNVAWTCSQQGGLERTTDGFASSQQITTPSGAPFVWELEIHPTVPTTIFGGFGDIYKSTDRGDNWTNLNSGAGEIEFISIAPSNADVIYVAGTDGSVKYTANGGTSWSAITVPTETPFGKTDKILGGSGTFVGLAASQFGVKTGVVSVVGGDFPNAYLEMMNAKGIDTEGIEIVQDGKTFFWSGRYHNDMNSRDTLITELNVLEHFNPVVPDSFKDAQVVMLGNLHPLTQASVLDQMEEKPKLVVLDTMNFWMDIALNDLHEVMKRIDVITINDEEARQLSGEYSLVNAAKKIHEMGPKYVVIKKGEHGALLFNEENMFYAPALPLAEVFDPTGAGDTFAGGFCGFLAKTEDVSFENMKNAIIYGSNLASFCVEKFGTQRMEELTKEEVTERLHAFKQLTQFDIEIE